jgi:hypothetical protein
MLFIGSSCVQLPLRQTDCQRKPLHDGLFPGSVWMVARLLPWNYSGLPVMRDETTFNNHVEGHWGSGSLTSRRSRELEAMVAG